MAAAALYFSHVTEKEKVDEGTGKKPCGVCRCA